MASSDSTATDTEGPVPCPLCEWSAGDRTDVYQHLMVSHRKSELSRTLLSLLEAARADTQQDGNPEFDDRELRSTGLLL